METVDILEFYKLLIDVTISAEVKNGNSSEHFPATDSGQVYFYPYIEKVNSEEAAARSTATAVQSKTAK